MALLRMAFSLLAMAGQVDPSIGAANDFYVLAHI